MLKEQFVERDLKMEKQRCYLEGFLEKAMFKLIKYTYTKT